MYIVNDDNHDSLLNSELLMDEAPIGWSSTCLDQTLFYYLDCNDTDHENSKSQIPLADQS
uniref:Uncharacterized protein n=1 Tax=Hildenbrandia rivularis TaxID=135206 RepID=A0A1C9CFI0_9FLOR|nr:hypothetical protein Hrvl_052 [Hildenbrandia rivularis]AOM67112.1 hypothetical protein Hrvl_052 [Hildenbrandia rivularis]